MFAGAAREESLRCSRRSSLFHSHGEAKAATWFYKQSEPSVGQVHTLDLPSGPGRVRGAREASRCVCARACVRACSVSGDSAWQASPGSQEHSFKEHPEA